MKAIVVGSISTEVRNDDNKIVYTKTEKFYQECANKEVAETLIAQIENNARHGVSQNVKKHTSLTFVLMSN